MSVEKVPTMEQRLQARFPDEKHEWRPGSALRSHKDECKGRLCRETHDADKHMQLLYVEDESVMDRLDEVFGVGGWSLSAQPIEDRCVRIAITAWIDGREVTKEDFGYASNDASEPMKEAVTDGIRRVGRMFGIARYVYAGEGPKRRPTKGATRTPAGPEREPDSEEGEDSKRPIASGVATIHGTAAAGRQAPVDLMYRQGPPEQGPTFGFVVVGPEGKGRTQVIAVGDLATDLWDAIGHDGANLQNREVSCEGALERVPWRKDGKEMPAYKRLTLARIETDEWSLPAPVIAAESDLSDIEDIPERLPLDLPEPA